MGFHQEKNSHGHTIWVKDGTRQPEELAPPQEGDTQPRKTHVEIPDPDVYERLNIAGVNLDIRGQEIQRLRELLEEVTEDRDYHKGRWLALLEAMKVKGPRF